jgi:hypothetical protein
VFELKGVKGGEECVEVIDGEPLGGFGTAVVFSVGAQAKGSDWFSGGRDVVDAAPHFDSRCSAIDFAVGVLICVTGEYEDVKGVRGEWREATVATEEDVLAEMG